MVSILEMYQEALKCRSPRGRPPKGGRRNALTSDDPVIQYIVSQWDDNREELKSTTKLNYYTSSQHIAWLVYGWHWTRDIPDDVWEYFVRCVDEAKCELSRK